jgi:hypothetical protein
MNAGEKGVVVVLCFSGHIQSTCVLGNLAATDIICLINFFSYYNFINCRLIIKICQLP